VADQLKKLKKLKIFTETTLKITLTSILQANFQSSTTQNPSATLKKMKMNLIRYLMSPGKNQ
jgi:hypothetical protein